MRGLSFDEASAALRPVQRKEGPADTQWVGAVAATGVKGAGSQLPHGEKIQAAFGRHDVSGVSAHVGGDARAASEAIGASAYASGNDVAFAGAPDLHTAAHEAAHVVQQRAGVQLQGGVGQSGDAYEKHADAVADQVVQGKSAEGLLDTMAGGGASGGVQAREAGPVQRYSRVPVGKQSEGNWNAGEDLRVADDGKMAVPEGESKRMFATQGVIAQAARVMQSQGSMYSVAPGGATLNGPVPSQRDMNRTLVEVVPTNIPMNKSGADMTTTEACSTHGMEVMGAGLRQGDHPHERGIGAVVGGQTRHWDRTGIGGDVPIVASVRDQMSGHQTPQTSSGQTTPEETKRSERAYEKMGTKERDREAKRLGVNQYAQPEVGQGIAVYNAVSKLKRGFPMHFAAVIAKSGGDYVTFENYAKTKDTRGEDTEDESKAWYFRMYGPPKKNDDQSFYGEHVKLGEQGGKKGTMVLTHKKVGGFANDIIVDGERCLSRWQPYAGAKMDRDNTPRFKQAYERFLQVFRNVKRDAKEAWLKDEPFPEGRFQELEEAIENCKNTEIGAHLMIDADPRNAPSHEEEVRQHQQPREILLDEEQIDEDKEKVDDD